MDARLTKDDIWDMYANQADPNGVAKRTVEKIKNDLREIDPDLPEHMAWIYAGIIRKMAIEKSK